MKRKFLRWMKPLLPAVLLSTMLQAQNKDATKDLIFHDALEFPVIDKYHDEANYNRLPAKFKATVRPEVWALGLNSAGIAIRFRSNASNIAAKWKVKNTANLNNMNATGVRGLDLYALVGEKWQYVNSGVPENTANSQKMLISGGKPEYREYLLFLPLYDGVDSLSIGINKDAEISKPATQHLLNKKPIVYYGSSIAQGGCASRPGLAYTNMLVRELQRPVINFGFSGNGMFEASVGEAMIEIDPALYVIDCSPNTSPELIHERAVKLVQQIRAKKPDVPVLLVENYIYEAAFFQPTIMDIATKKQVELKKAYDELIESGVKHLYYKTGENFIGTDHEGTVDGIHPSDLGMKAFAEHILPTLQKLTKGQP
ncbi:SGNH/GDSL hydrolase family protein [Chitinophaga sp. Hz27]|uniref:SGNH/GDSL hydrolase family protein n=1 Tax=Chitinophaga sp. Hz27 TaxID=3347169 RepID=UPI0035DC868C